MVVVIRDRVPSEPFRRRVEELQAQGVSLSQIALRAGWIRLDRGHEKGDTSYLQRVLGLRTWTSGPWNGVPRGPYEAREHMSYEAAVKLCDALGLDYHEMGI